MLSPIKINLKYQRTGCYSQIMLIASSLHNHLDPNEVEQRSMERILFLKSLHYSVDNVWIPANI